MWIQQYGRAGQNAEEAHAYLLFNENLDIKILKFWLRETKIEAEKECKTVDDFVEVLKYIFHSFAGNCLRELEVKYFKDEPTPKLKPVAMSCRGCSVE